MTVFALQGAARVEQVFLRALVCAVVWLLVHATPASAEAQSFDLLALKVTVAPEDLVAGNELRRWCRTRKAVDRCVEFFNELTGAYPEASGARYNAALAYIDKLPGHSLLVQAKLSTSSIAHATTIIDRKPGDWLALYIRGLNNLYWPKWYRRAGRTAVDMQSLINATEALPDSERRPYMALAYVALGDAYVLLDEPEEARRTWTRGAALYRSAELQQRLSLKPEELTQKIEAIRSRERPVDTDLAFYTDQPMRDAQGAVGRAQ